MPRVAAIQLNAGADINKNLNLTRDLVVQACEEGAVLAALPECFAFMAADDQQRLHFAEPESTPGLIQNFLSDLANELGIWILAAGVFVRSRQSNMVRNASFLFDDRGAGVCRYDKIHLFNVNLSNGERYSESRYTEAGTEIVIQDTPVGTCGLTNCYDVRFPSLYKQLAADGATWFAVPSAFAYTTGKDHWEVLLRARAIENQAYVVAPAQWGRHPGDRQTYGHSMIVDPWGQIVACQAEGNGVIYGEIEIDRVNSIRRRFMDLQN